MAVIIRVFPHWRWSLVSSPVRLLSSNIGSVTFSLQVAICAELWITNAETVHRKMSLFKGRVEHPACFEMV